MRRSVLQRAAAGVSSSALLLAISAAPASAMPLIQRLANALVPCVAHQGDHTLQGYGGLSYVDVCYGGAEGTLSIVAGTERDGTGAQVTTFRLDAPTGGVASNSASDNEIVAGTAAGYGTSITYHFPYWMKLKGAAGWTRWLKIVGDTNVAHITVMCRTVDTVCHDAAATANATVKADSATTNQLKTEIGSALVRPFDIVWRQAPQWGSTISAGFNQIAGQGSTWSEFSPAGGYSGSGYLTVRSEHPNLGSDAGGAPLQGGGPNLGQIRIGPSSGEANLHLRFNNLTFYVNYAGTMAPSAGFILLSGKGYGIEVHNSHFEIGPNVTNPSAIYGIDIGYNGTNGTDCGGLAMCDYVVADSYFKNTGPAAISIQQTNATTQGAEPVAGIITGNTIIGQINDAIEVNATFDTDVERNLVENPNPSSGNHPDALQIFPTSIGINPSSPAGLSAGTYLYNYAVRNYALPGTGVGTLTLTSAGSGYTPGTYTSASLRSLTGSGQRMDVTVHVGTVAAFATAMTSSTSLNISTFVAGTWGSGLIAVGQAVYSGAGVLLAHIASLGSGTGGTGTYNLDGPITIGAGIIYIDGSGGAVRNDMTVLADEGGSGYQVGDTLGTPTTPPTGLAGGTGFVATVATLAGRHDFQGAPFANWVSSSDSYATIKVEGNIANITYANGVTIWRVNSPVVRGNVALNNSVADAGPRANAYIQVNAVNSATGTITGGVFTISSITGGAPGARVAPGEHLFLAGVDTGWIIPNFTGGQSGAAGTYVLAGSGSDSGGQKTYQVFMVGGTFDYNLANAWLVDHTVQQGTITCRNNAGDQWPGCAPLLPTIGAGVVNPYPSVYANLDETADMGSRAKVIRQFTPKDLDTMSDSIIYSGPFKPMNNYGEVCENDFTPFVHSAHCAAAGQAGQAAH